jgi:hypothetical protein
MYNLIYIYNCIYCIQYIYNDVNYLFRLNEEQGIPIFKYGPVSPNQRALKDVRRDLGYFILVSRILINMYVRVSTDAIL